jgi:hypothetical protein
MSWRGILILIGIFITYIWPTSEKNESDISVSDGFKEVVESNKESFRQNANDINKDKRLAKKFETYVNNLIKEENKKREDSDRSDRSDRSGEE